MGSESDDREALRERITHLHQRLNTATERVSTTFAAQQGLHPIDLEALLAVMHAERAGRPLTPGELGVIVRLSSAATTGLIDRLEAAGHLTRRRDARDRRRIHLLYADHGMRVAEEFFRPLGVMTQGLLDRYTVEELRVIISYLAAAADAMAEHADRLGGAGPTAN
ncbi:MAG: MarR family transcriptional regulator [Leifsonia sp.]